jgi:DNA-binding HxlR family transcriptional regulator
MKRTSFAKMHCSIARSLELIGDGWAPLIIRDLFLGVTRFDDIAENLGIPRNSLARRLDTLVENGIAERAAYREKPRRYEYRLTKAGRDFVPILIAITAWGDRWAPLKEGKPILFAHEECEKKIHAEITCSACGDPLTADNVKALPGPGGAAKAGTKVIARRLVGAR